MVSQVKTSPPLRGEPWFSRDGIPTLRAVEYLEGSEQEIISILARLDLIEDRLDVIESRLDAIDIEIAAIKVRLDALEALQFIQITAAANHTTTRNEIITCTNTNTITISLNATPNTIPAANEESHITVTDAPVILSGNGKLINGRTSITIKAPNSRNVIYNSDADAWFIR